MKSKNKKIKIAVDALGINLPGGARTAVLFLFEHMVREKPDWGFVFYLSKAEETLNFNNVTQVILPFKKGIVARLFLQLFLPFDLFFRKVDLIHFTKSQASLVWKIKKVFTIFDMTTLIYPDQFSKFTEWYWKNIQGRMAKFVDAIVTISHNAANDIARFYRIPLEKIYVIHLASQFQESQAIPPNHINDVNQKYNLSNTYFLYVGLLALKKNLDTIIHAMKILKDRDKAVPNLVMVGPHYSSSDASFILELIERLRLSENISYLGVVDQKTLRIIFSQAQCLILPSIHEGFGITALEAMQLGIPVIASKAGAIPEVVGDAALLVEDYLNSEAWSEALSILNESKDVCQKFIQSGKQQAGRFSWEQATKSLIKVYSDLLGLH